MPEDGDQYVGLCVACAKKLLLYEEGLYDNHWNTQGFFFQPYLWETTAACSVSGHSQCLCLLVPVDAITLDMGWGSITWYWRHTHHLFPYATGPRGIILDIHETMQPLDFGSDPQHVTEACTSHSNPLLMNLAWIWGCGLSLSPFSCYMLDWVQR